MPRIDFRGKQFVYSHHLTVPVKSIEINERKSFANSKKRPATLEESLIINADNLQAMKALLPYVGGKVNLIYIDPPYNTGSERWKYNDNVNSPLMKQWLKEGVVEAEDLSRHDKWLCMMWPRLQLMKELLAEDGAIFVSIDDHEMSYLKPLMDEVFGRENWVASLVWRKKPGGGQDSLHYAREHEYILLYRKSESFNLQLFKKKDIKKYNKIINGRRCKLIPLEKWGSNSRRVDAPTAYYPIKDPDGKDYHPVNPDSEEGCWRKKPEKLDSDHIHWTTLSKKKGRRPFEVEYHDEAEGKREVPRTILYKVADTAQAAKELKKIFGEKAFDNSKPSDLIKELLRFTAGKDALVMDAFAGTGTTGHAVLKLNSEDKGSRKFILIESEKHADSITAERIRRVAKAGDLKEAVSEGGGALRILHFGNGTDRDKLVRSQETSIARGAGDKSYLDG